MVKASDFDSDMRGFESFLPCQISITPEAPAALPVKGATLAARQSRFRGVCLGDRDKRVND